MQVIYSYLARQSHVKLALKYFFIAMLCCFFSLQKLSGQNATDSLNAIHCYSFSLDRYGNYYLTSKEGAIFRYDSLQQANLLYSPEKTATITLLEARNALQIFAFYRDYQEYTLFDRFLTPLKTNSFKDTPINMARLACPALDGEVWVIDEIDFSLVKYNPLRNDISLKVPLALLLPEQEYDICFMTEYQNQLFIVDKNRGILVFDNLGNYKHSIGEKGISYCNFMNEKIYYVTLNHIVIQDIYTHTLLQKIPTTQTPFYIALYPNKILCVGKQVYWIKL
jgi:hypothetical protein